jgi:multiple sugar transport system permease protein
LLAFVISILKPRGSKVVYYLVLFSMLIPVTMALAPLSKNIYAVYDFIGKLFGGTGADIQKTYLVFLPFWLIAGASPFNFLLFKSYFDNLPKDLFEMAEIEGANKFQIFFKIVIPISLPIIMVVSIFTITSTWNDFLLPYVIITSDKLWTVMIKVFTINAQMYAYGVSLDELLCLLVFTMIPPLIIFFIFQKNITNNQVSSGIK